MTPSFSEWMQDLLYDHEHKVLDDFSYGEAIRNVSLHGLAGDFEHDLVKEHVDHHRLVRAFAGPFDEPNLSHGQIFWGKTLKGKEVRTPVGDLTYPMFVDATTGGGKTTQGRRILIQCAPTVPGMFVFDFRKREYGCLAPYFKKLGRELLVPDVPESLRLNPLEVPAGTSPNDYAPNIAEVLSRVLGLPPGASKILEGVILQLYANFNVSSGSGTHARTLFPTLYDLYLAVSSIRTMHPQTRRAILDSLEPVLLSLNKVLACRRGHSVRELMRHCIAFQCSGMSDTAKNLIVNVLVLQAFLLLLNQGVSNPEELLLLILCDEASRLVGSAHSSISNIIPVIRGCGIGLILMSQNAQMSPIIHSNTPNKILGLTSNYQDLHIIGSAMGLTNDQRRWLLHNLVPGTFCMFFGQGEYRKPFICRVPHLKVPSQFAQFPARQTLPDLGSVPAPEFANWRAGFAHQIQTTCTSPNPMPSAPALANGNGSPAPRVSLTTEESRFLQAVVDTPGLSVSEYPKRVHMSPRKATTLRKRLKTKGLLKEELAQRSTRGRPAILLFPTQLGVKVLQP